MSKIMPRFIHSKKSFAVELNNKWLWAIVIIAFLCVFYSFFSYWSQPHNITLFLNPDLNAYTYMARNIIDEQGSIFLWHIGTAPFFIPEIALLYLSTLFFKNPYPNFIIYALFQFFAFIAIMLATFKVVINSQIGIRIGLLSVLVFLLMLILYHPFLMYSPVDYLSAILVPGFHFGCALMVWFSLFLLLKILIQPERKFLKAFLFITLILAGISDPLIYIYFTFPIILTLTAFYLFNKTKKYLGLILLLILAFIIAFVIYHIIPIPYVQVKFKFLVKSIYFSEFFKSMSLFIHTDRKIAIIWSLFIIFAPVSLAISYFSKNKTKNNNYYLIDFVIFYNFVMVFFSSFIIILTIGQVIPSAASYIPLRYMIPLILGPAFFGFPLLAYKHINIINVLNKNWVFAGILMLLAMFAIKKKPDHFYEENLFHFQPKLMACFNKQAQKYQLHNGISDEYFIANMLTAFENQSNIHVALVADDLVPIHWQNTLQVYGYHDYNFVILGKRDLYWKPTLLRHFGNPTATFTCDGNYIRHYYIYVYNNGAMQNMFAGYMKQNSH